MNSTTEAGATLTIAVTGMSCGSCKRHVEHALGGVPGVSEARVELATGSAVITYDPATAAPEALLEAVREAGYGAEAAEPK
ncbi:MAG TPA: heavy metal-associated domain-containing protein [Longimicrobium sp.]|nr:heavy metal-associated domain-containing protein [Longimicrobium sp.]